MLNYSFNVWSRLRINQHMSKEGKSVFAAWALWYFYVNYNAYTFQLAHSEHELYGILGLTHWLMTTVFSRKGDVSDGLFPTEPWPFILALCL